MKTKCKLDGCESNTKAKGFCKKHYHQDYANRHIEKNKAYSKQYYQENREEVKEYGIKYRAENRDKVLEDKRNYYAKISGTPLGRYKSYKSKSNARAVEFKLTLEEFQALTDRACSYCGGFTPERSYTGIDRVDSSRGYESNNCAPCCSLCNMAKSDLDLSEFKSHVSKMAKHMEL